jgi:protocatechuate 3,4-dioxygenase beta subunit
VTDPINNTQPQSPAPEDADNDDRPIGRILSRREVLALVGLAGVAGWASRWPRQTATAQQPAQATLDKFVYLPFIGKSEEPIPTSTPTATTTAAPTQTPTQTPTPTPTATSNAVATPTSTATSSPTPTGTITVPACVVRPAKTEGPYFVDEKLNRSDIRSDPGTGAVKAGVLLNLTFRVSNVANGGCTVLPNALVDIWHCDAAGLYSDVSQNNTVGQKFLRGYQTTDTNGLAKFITIYPGWYPGRVTHIHFKIRITQANNQTYDFTSQLFFDDALTEQVYTQAPYNLRGPRDRTNANDSLYSSQLLLTLTQTGNTYDAVFDIALSVI